MSTTDAAAPGYAFDHLVIGGSDLDAAVGQYGDLGFTVVPGGRHTGKGTHNALIILRAGYLELIAPFDREEARAAGRRRLVDYLDEHGAGFVAYALETTDIDALARRMTDAGTPATGPFAMQRVQDDGTTVSWRLLVPGGSQYRQWWPFFIQWDTPPTERFGAGGAGAAGGSHPNGARTVDELVIAVRDLDVAAEVAGSAFGLTPDGRGRRSDLAAQYVRYRLADTRLTLASPDGPGPLAKSLTAEGEGPFETVLAVDDADRLAETVGDGLRAAGADDDGAPLLRVAGPGGARLAFRARRPPP